MLVILAVLETVKFLVLKSAYLGDETPSKIMIRGKCNDFWAILGDYKHRFILGIPFTVAFVCWLVGQFFPTAFLISKLVLATKKVAHLQKVMLNFSLIQVYRVLISVQNFWQPVQRCWKKKLKYIINSLVLYTVILALK